jgi:hypothetical protein
MQLVIILNNMKNNLLRTVLVAFSFLLIFVALFFLIPNSCKNNFKVYPEKGYCEFNLKNCEGIFGCKEYNNVQVPCGSMSTLCGEKMLCDCSDSLNNEIVEPENNRKANSLPDSFKADYISFSNYGSSIFKIEDYRMPGLSVINGEIDCQETSLNPSVATLTSSVINSKKEINGKKYCVTYSIEGAAGSVFTQNAYTTVINDNVYLIIFVARYNNCGNYPEEELVKCHVERENFNLDLLVDEEIEKLKIKN